jgi:hypothetical protein
LQAAFFWTVLLRRRQLVGTISQAVTGHGRPPGADGLGRAAVLTYGAARLATRRLRRATTRPSEQLPHGVEGAFAPSGLGPGEEPGPDHGKENSGSPPSPPPAPTPQRPSGALPIHESSTSTRYDRIPTSLDAESPVGGEQTGALVPQGDSSPASIDRDRDRDRDEHQQPRGGDREEAQARSLRRGLRADARRLRREGERLSDEGEQLAQQARRLFLGPRRSDRSGEASSPSAPVEPASPPSLAPETEDGQ